MAYTRVPKVVAGTLWSATNHNTYVRDNMTAIADNAVNPMGKLIQEVKLTGDSSLITLGDIPSHFYHLRVTLRGRMRVPGATGGVITFNFNGDYGANYYNETISATGSGAGVSVSQNIANTTTGVATFPSDSAPQDYAGMATLFIYGYRNAYFGKSGNIEYGFKENTSGSTVRRRWFFWASTAAINRITIGVDTYTDLRFLEGTIISLYGLF